MSSEQNQNNTETVAALQQRLLDEENTSLINTDAEPNDLEAQRITPSNEAELHVAAYFWCSKKCLGIGTGIFIVAALIGIYCTSVATCFNGVIVENKSSQAWKSETMEPSTAVMLPLLINPGKRGLVAFLDSVHDTRLTVTSSSKAVLKFSQSGKKAALFDAPLLNLKTKPIEKWTCKYVLEDKPNVLDCQEIQVTSLLDHACFIKEVKPAGTECSSKTLKANGGSITLKFANQESAMEIPTIGSGTLIVEEQGNIMRVENSTNQLIYDKQKNGLCLFNLSSLISDDLINSHSNEVRPY